MNDNQRLRQARKNMNLSLQDAAYIINADVSNLSKCERENRPLTVRCTIAYMLITGVSIRKLINRTYFSIKAEIIERTKILLQELNKVPDSAGIIARRNSVELVMRNVSKEDMDIWKN